MRPSLAEIKRQLTDTALRQLMTTPAGMALSHSNPDAVGQLVGNIVNNCAQVVGGMFDEFCGEEE